MNLEELMKQMLGDNYKDNLTQEDLEKFFKDKILGSGEYENKGKATAEKQKLEKQIADLNAKLAGKMSDDEKKAADDEAKEAKIAELEKKLAESNLINSKSKALTGLNKIKDYVEIKDKDKDFDKLLEGITFEDGNKSSEIGAIISNLVENAYKAGQAKGTKNQLADMGSFKAGSDGQAKEEGSLGKEVAESVKSNQKIEKDFFERK